MATKSAIITLANGQKFRACWDTFNNQYGWGGFNYRWFVTTGDQAEYVGDFKSIKEVEEWLEERECGQRR